MTALFSPQPSLFPELSYSVQAFIRIAYGILLLATLLWALPQWCRFFLGERWGGYGNSTRSVEAVQNPVIMPAILVAWFFCGGLIAAGIGGPWPAAINLLLCRYFFIGMRWEGLLRGMGAPGFVCYWAGLTLFLLEYTAHYAPELRSLALLFLQVDFAFIYLSSGIYKFSAGYTRNHGMELGMVNPAWGYWWRHYKKMPPSHLFFKSLNHLAWSSQVLAGVLMLIPETRFLGGTIIIFMFLFIATQIRLGWLCETVMFCSGLIFFHPGSLGDHWVGTLMGAWPAPSSGTYPGAPMVNLLLEGTLYVYLLCLPLAHAGLSYNFYLKRSLPAPLQRTLERYTNFFGLIVWRVFSVDIVNFFIRIYTEPRSGEGPRSLMTRYEPWQARYFHVAESIVLACIFTTLKYYPSNSQVFRKRVLRYARTVRHSPEDVLVFEYLNVKKAEDRFEFVPVAEFRVDVADESVTEHVLDASCSVRAAHAVSPVHEGTRPGTYVPLSR